MTSIDYDDLGAWEQAMVDRAGVLDRHSVVKLMNDFDIHAEQLSKLYGAFHANGKLKFRRKQSERAHRASNALAAVLECMRDWPKDGIYYADDDGKLVFDMLGMNHDGHKKITNVSTLIALLEATSEEAAQIANAFDEVASEVDAEVAGRSNRLKVSRYWYWIELLRFWRDVLGRSVKVTIDPYEDNLPKGPVIDFIVAASMGCIPARERTPNAIRNFIRKNRDRL